MSLRNLVGGVTCDPAASSSQANPLRNFLQRPFEDAEKIHKYQEFQGTVQTDIPATVWDDENDLVNDAKSSDPNVEELGQLFESVWQTAPRVAGRPIPGHELPQDFSYEQIWQGGVNAAPPDPIQGCLQTLISSSRTQEALVLPAVPLIAGQLSAAEQIKVRDRTSILARHLFPDQPDHFVHAQVGWVLRSLGVDDVYTNQHDREQQFESIFSAATDVQAASHLRQGEDWAGEFERSSDVGPGTAWTDEYVAFAAQQATRGNDNTRNLVQQLSSQDDPKWRNSNFLHFVSDINNGDVEIIDNQVVRRTTNGYAALAEPLDDWAREFEDLRSLPQQQLDDQEPWLRDFADFANLPLPDDSAIAASESSTYEFESPNPYVSVPMNATLEHGVALFEEGRVRDAILVLEAVVQQAQHLNDPHAWRALGDCNQESDNDSKAISCYRRALTVDASDARSLLALGVSYTNELDSHRALSYLHQWMAHSPRYQSIAAAYPQPPETGSVSVEQLTAMFSAAAQHNSEDADVFLALGVLYNVSRDYERASSALQTAVNLRPSDYSLWNKLGATLANSYQNDDAMEAYKAALKLRPTYLRAWANLGICYSNQGRYQDAANTYLTALRLSPNAEHLWTNLSIAFTCWGRNDFVELAAQRQLDRFPPQV